MECFLTERPLLRFALFQHFLYTYTQLFGVIGAHKIDLSRTPFSVVACVCGVGWCCQDAWRSCLHSATHLEGQFKPLHRWWQTYCVHHTWDLWLTRQFLQMLCRYNSFCCGCFCLRWCGVNISQYKVVFYTQLIGTKTQFSSQEIIAASLKPSVGGVDSWTVIVGPNNWLITN